MFSPDNLIFRTAEKNLSEQATGEYRKNILILALTEPESPGNKAFLEKVLGAANLDLQRDTLFAEIPSGEPVNCFAGLPGRPEAILVFGLPPAQAGLSIETKTYAPIHFYQTRWLFADPLSILEPDRQRKSALWNALKEMFLNG